VTSTQAIRRSSRFRILALLIGLAALTALAMGCGGGDESPESTLRDASMEGIDSGNVDLSLQVSSVGRESGNVELSLTGPFRRKAELPQVALKATVEGEAGGEAIDLEGGLTLLSDRGFFNYEGTEYEIDPEYFGLAKPTFLPLAPGQGKKGTVSALNGCLEAASGLDLGSFGNNLSEGGNADVDGTATTKISGDLDVPAVLAALVELAEDPSCETQLTAAGRSAAELEQLESELAGTVKKAHVEIYVGDDDIIRKVAGELVAEPKGSGRDRVEAEFELTLSEVNEGPEIVAPAGGKPILVWLEGLGIDPFDALFLVGEKEGLGRILELAAADAFPAPQG
jgi:hypothetical protein